MSNPTLELPLLPLRDTVVLPGMVAPLFIGRRKSLEAIERAVAGDGRLFLAAQRSGHLINPEKEDLYHHGTIGRVVERVQLPDRSVKIMAEGLERGRVEAVLETQPGFVCTIQPWRPPIKEIEAASALIKEAHERFKKLHRVSRRLTTDALRAVQDIHDPALAIDMMVPHLSLRFQDRQRLLEIESFEALVTSVIELLSKETEALAAERRSRARQAPTKGGAAKGDQPPDPERDEFQAELAEMEAKLEKKNMPDYARERARRELKKLRMMSPMSAEATVVRNYLDWIVALPWDDVTKDKLDIDAAERVLDEDHHGLHKIKERILEYLAVRQLAGELRGPILCFVGPPGVGKTSLARSIGRATGRNYVRLSLGGVRDEAEIRGHRRTYIGAFPGKIIQSLRRAEASNPVLLLDEVDKLTMDFRGDPAAALLEVLDPEQNATFLDHYLDLEYDLSRVLFITTANQRESIPVPLLDRMEIIELSGYTEYEKLHIANDFLIPKQQREHGLRGAEIAISDNAIRAIVNRYTREAGVRSLERELASIMRKVARDVVQNPGEGRRYNIGRTSLKRYLGEARFRKGKAEDTDEIGAATGLAVTYAGGDILVIEVCPMRGAGKLTLTGKLGDVMQESARAAMSYVRSRASGLGLDPDFHQQTDVHVHIPEGAIKKDGPSAGITLATALASALMGVPVHKDVAMTGEITLRGKVLPVGGVKEKLLAASRSGFRTVLIPADNEKDLKEIPPQIRASLNIELVRGMDEVLRAALRLDGRPLFPDGARADKLEDAPGPARPKTSKAKKAPTTTRRRKT